MYCDALAIYYTLYVYLFSREGRVYNVKLYQSINDVLYIPHALHMPHTVIVGSQFGLHLFLFCCAIFMSFLTI